MSIIDIEDVQYVPSDEIVQTQQSNNDVMIHQLPSNDAQINTQALQDSDQHQPMPSSFDDNSEIVPVAVIHDGRNDHYPLSRNILDINEYKIWSVLNLLFCCFIVGAFALTMSLKTRRNKRHGDILAARNFSELAAILNIVATLSGILIFTFATLRYTEHIKM